MNFEVVLKTKHIVFILVLIVVLIVGVSASTVELSSTGGGSQGHSINHMDFGVCSIVEESGSSANCGSGETVFFGGCEGDDIKASYPGPGAGSWECIAQGSVDKTRALCCPFEPGGSVKMPLSFDGFDFPSDTEEDEKAEFYASISRRDGKEISEDDLEDYRGTIREYDDDGCSNHDSTEEYLSAESDSIEIVDNDPSYMEFEYNITMSIDSGEYCAYFEVKPDGMDSYQATGDYFPVYQGCSSGGGTCDADSDCCNDLICDNGECCVAENDPCDSHSDCCEGFACQDGSCAQVEG